MLVIGLGTGRCGTVSLTKLINQQPDSICFHELNPSCIKFEGTPKPVFNTISEFQSILNGGDPGLLTVDFASGHSSGRYQELQERPRINCIGDVSFYYLRYVRGILEIDRTVKFPCLKRARDETVDSWMKKVKVRRWRHEHAIDYFTSLVMGRTYYRSRNLWVEHDGSVWQPDPVWDKCFPKYETDDLRTAIEMYWDEYYAVAEQLEADYPGNVRIFPIEELGSPAGQDRILDFIGFDKDRRVHVEAHSNKSRTPKPV